MKSTVTTNQNKSTKHGKCLESSRSTCSDSVVEKCVQTENGKKVKSNDEGSNTCHMEKEKKAKGPRNNEEKLKRLQDCFQEEIDPNDKLLKVVVCSYGFLL